MTTCNGAGQTGIFRAIEQTLPSTDKPKNITLAIEADKKAKTIFDKSGITVAFEDYTELAKSPTPGDKSEINKEYIKPTILDKVAHFFGKKENNIFKTPGVKEAIKEQKYYNQDEIFKEDIEKNGGLLYKKENDDLYKSALNYTKADINAVQQSVQYVKKDYTSKKSSLNSIEISSYIAKESFLEDNMKILDLDGDPKHISAKEYASYLIVADGLKENDNKEGEYNNKNCDGKITATEATLFKNADVDMLKASAQSIFDKNYKK